MDENERDTAFALAFAEHYRYLLTVAMRYAPTGYSQDAVQAALLNAWIHRRKFRGEASLKTWLGAIVKNEAYRMRRLVSRECELPILADRGNIYRQIDDCLTLEKALRHADPHGISVLKTFLANPPDRGELTGADRMKRIRAIAEIRRRLLS